MHGFGVQLPIGFCTKVQKCCDFHENHYFSMKTITCSWFMHDSRVQIPIEFCKKKIQKCCDFHKNHYFFIKISWFLWKSSLVHELCMVFSDVPIFSILPEALYLADPVNSDTAWSALPRKSTQLVHCLNPSTPQIYSIGTLPEALYRTDPINSDNAWSHLPRRSTQLGHCLKPCTTHIHSIRTLPEALYQPSTAQIQ